MDGFFESPAPPPLPPGTAAEAEVLARLRLIRSARVGPQTFRRLLGEHGSGQAALAALPALAAASGAKDYQPCPEGVAMAELAAGKRHGARLLHLGEPSYPDQLSAIPDPPPCLWVTGNSALISKPSIAMVGARNASSLGLRMARQLALDLGKSGLVVTSGLARGIDAECHRAALASGTIAVVAGGLDVVYPRENSVLHSDIATHGLIVSEQPFGLRPQARHFPRRNRLISGLSIGLVVVEAATKSGSMITARDAADQNREVMAVPGHPMDARASGCNLLIRDGATLIRSAQDILQATARPTAPRAVPQPSQNKRKPPAQPTAQSMPDLLNLLGPSPVSEDLLIRQTSASAAQVLQQLTELEINGQIERHPGGLVSRI